MWICGAEKLDARSSQIYLNYSRNEGEDNLVYFNYSNVFYNDDNRTCPIMSYSLIAFVNNQFQPYTGSSFTIDQGTKEISISTNTPGLHEVYLKVMTKGNVVGYKPIRAYVCGLEQVGYKPDAVKKLEFEWDKDSGFNRTWIIPKKKYLSLVSSTIPACPIELSLTRVQTLKFDYVSRRDEIIDYPNNTI